jgi:hypothetical protein
MITRKEERERCDEAIELLRREEIQVLTFLNTAFLGAKALIPLPEQTMVAHWFQPEPEGCVVLSLSTEVTDLDDLFTNPQIVRETTYGG